MGKRVPGEKSGAVGTATAPGGIEPRDAARVELPRAPRALDPAKHPGMDDDETEKRGRGHDRPDGRQSMTDEGLPGKDRHRHGERKPRARDQHVRALTTREVAAPTVRAPDIFRARVSGVTRGSHLAALRRYVRRARSWRAMAA